MSSADGTKGRRYSAMIFCISLIAVSIPVIMVHTGSVSGTLFVGPDSTYKNITAALEAADPGETIILENGTYNGSFEIDKPGIHLTTNLTSDAFLVTNGTGPLITVLSDKVTISNLNISGGQLLVKGNNTSIMNCNIRAQSVRAVGTSGVLLKDTGFLSPPDGAINITSCANVTISNVLPDTVHGTFMDISASRNVLVEDCRAVLNSTSVWASLSDTDDLSIKRNRISDRGEGNIAVSLKNTSMVSMDRMEINVSRAAMRVMGSRNVNITNCNISAGGGVLAEHVEGLAFHDNRFDVVEDSTGMELRHVKGLVLERHSFMLQGDLARGMVGDRIENFTVSFLSSNSLGRGCSLISLKTALRGELDNMTVNLAGPGCRGLSIDSAYNISISKSMLTSTGRGARILRVNDTYGFSMENNRFDSQGFYSSVICLSNATISRSFQNQITTSGTGSFGLNITDSFPYMIQDRISVQGTSGTGIMSTGSTMNITDLRMDVAGADSYGVVSSMDLTALLNDCQLEVTGNMSTGILMRGDIWEAHMVDGTIEVGGEAKVGISVREGPVVRMENCVLNTTSEHPVVDCINGSVTISNSTLNGFEKTLFLKNSHGEVRFSTLSSTRNVVSSNSTLHMDTVEMEYLLNSLELMQGSRAELVDSTGIGPKLDPSSHLFVMNRVDLRTIDRFGEPLSGVELEVRNWGHVVYSTERFTPGSPDPTTGQYGYIEKIKLLDAHYNGSSQPTRGTTEVEVYLKGTAERPWSETYQMNTSYPHTELLRSPDIDLPAVPTGLSASPMPGKQSIFLQWELNEDDTMEYWIFERILPEGELHLADKVQANNATWSSDDLGPSTRAAYFLKAWDGTWNSEPSDIAITETLDLEAPPAPSAVFYENVTQDSVSLRWTHAGAEDLAGFSVLMNSTPSQIEFSEVERTGANTRGALISGLAWGTMYTFKVRAFDTSDNWSPPSEGFEISTSLPRITISLNVSYGDEGPKAGMPGVGCLFEVVENKNISYTGNITDPNGTAELTGLVPGRTYTIRVYPPAELRGEMGEKTGYLTAVSAPIFTDPYYPVTELDLELDYYLRVITGSIKALVTFQDGPRAKDAVFEARVDLLSENGVQKASKLTSGEGRASFIIEDLPFRGRFRIEPPSDLAGDSKNNVSGYLGTITNFFELTEEDPDGGIIEASLEYYDHIPLLEDLDILIRSPVGNAVSLGEDLTIMFNQPVDTSTVIGAFSIKPAIKNASFSWSNSNKTLTISHDDLVPNTEYTVKVGMQARSADGTGFPPTFTNNTWTFTTTKLPKETPDENDNDRMILIIALLIVLAVIAILIYSRYSSKKEEEEDIYGSGYTEYGEDYEEDFYDTLDDMEDEYPDDIAESMMAGEEGFEEEFEEEELLEEEDILEDEIEEEEMDLLEENTDEELIEEMEEDEIPEDEMEEEIPEEEVTAKKRKGKKK